MVGSALDTLQQRFSTWQLLQTLPPEPSLWLNPAEVAAITGFSVRWLEEARQGKKEIQGPAYIKLGAARNAQIRYKHTDVLDWMRRCEETHAVSFHRVATRFADFGQFKVATPDSQDRWLFILVPGSPPIEFFQFVTAYQATFADQDDTSRDGLDWCWLTHGEYSQGQAPN